MTYIGLDQAICPSSWIALMRNGLILPACRATSRSSKSGDNVRFSGYRCTLTLSPIPPKSNTFCSKANSAKSNEICPTLDSNWIAPLSPCSRKRSRPSTSPTVSALWAGRGTAGTMRLLKVSSAAWKQKEQTIPYTSQEIRPRPMWLTISRCFTTATAFIHLSTTTVLISMKNGGKSWWRSLNWVSLFAWPYHHYYDRVKIKITISELAHLFKHALNWIYRMEVTPPSTCRRRPRRGFGRVKWRWRICSMTTRPASRDCATPAYP